MLDAVLLFLIIWLLDTLRRRSVGPSVGHAFVKNKINQHFRVKYVILQSCHHEDALLASWALFLFSLYFLPSKAVSIQPFLNNYTSHKVSSVYVASLFSNGPFYLPSRSIKFRFQYSEYRSKRGVVNEKDPDLGDVESEQQPRTVDACWKGSAYNNNLIQTTFLCITRECSSLFLNKGYNNISLQ